MENAETTTSIQPPTGSEAGPVLADEVLTNLPGGHPIEQFQQVWAGRHSSLEVRPGTHGQREVRFTLHGGLDNLRAARDEINEAMTRALNYPVNGFRVFLSGNKDLPKDQDVTVTYTPVINDSGNRARHGTDPATSHEALIIRLGLHFVDNDLHRLACGAFRVKEGFPKDPDLIGTASDKGDLNEGMIVRTESGLYAGTVTTNSNGVSNGEWLDITALPFLVVAGEDLPSSARS